LICHFDLDGNKKLNMQAAAAIDALSALAQEHRLAAFRLLVQVGEQGMQERRHRSLIYRANYREMNALVSYLMENCCAGADCGNDVGCDTPTIERKSA